MHQNLSYWEPKSKIFLGRGHTLRTPPTAPQSSHPRTPRLRRLVLPQLACAVLNWRLKSSGAQDEETEPCREFRDNNISSEKSYLKTRSPFNRKQTTDRIHRHACCSCDLDLDLMTLTYKLDLTILKMYRHTRNELYRSRLSEGRVSKVK